MSPAHSGLRLVKQARFCRRACRSVGCKPQSCWSRTLPKKRRTYLLGRYHPPRRNLRRALEQILDQEFHSRWKRDGRILGASNKIHRIDYVVEIGRDRQLLLDMVVPEASSINAAVVAHLDVKQYQADKF